MAERRGGTTLNPSTIFVVRTKDGQMAYVSLPLAPPKLLLSSSLLEDA